MTTDRVVLFITHLNEISGLLGNQATGSRSEISTTLRRLLDLFTEQRRSEVLALPGGEAFDSSRYLKFNGMWLGEEIGNT